MIEPAAPGEVPLAKTLGPVFSTDTAYRAAEFIETYTARAFYPLNPDPAAVDIIHIAHALSNQCRYGGAVDVFYSTAQHCCLLADYTAKVLRGTSLDCLQILIHDAPEAYLVDVPRPVKQYMPEYRKWDHDIMDVIREWLSISEIAIPPYQDEIDSRIIIDERASLKAYSGLDWGCNLEALCVEIVPWVPRYAEQQFLMRYTAWTNAVFGSPQYMHEGWGDDPRLQASYHDTASDSAVIGDLIEVDLRGGVGRVKLRSPDGMLIRDTSAGRIPRPLWKWVHGKFTLIEGATNNVVRREN